MTSKSGGGRRCFLCLLRSLFFVVFVISRREAREQTPRINKWESSSLMCIFMAGFGVVLT